MKVRNVVLCIFAVMAVAAVLNPNKQNESGAANSTQAGGLESVKTPTSQALEVSTQPAALTAVTAPPQQTSFNGVVDRYRTAFDTAKNDMAAGAQRPQRGKELCAALKGLAVKDWTGFITELSSNSDGFGVLTVETGKGITLGTWNNSLSDINDNTLIKPDSKVLAQVMTLSEKQAVTFSGTFLPNKIDCVKEQSMTLSGAMTDPEFVFRFTKVEPMGELIK